MIYLAGDHGGFLIKKRLLEWLKEQDYTAVDLGPFSQNPDDDYPDFVIPASKKVAENEKNLGIFICRNGVGVSMLANKFEGIRAGLTFSKKHAISAKTDDNTNVLCLPADYLDEDEAVDICEAWLGTAFSFDTRHIKRLKKFPKL